MKKPLDIYTAREFALRIKYRYPNIRIDGRLRFTPYWIVRTLEAHQFQLHRDIRGRLTFTFPSPVSAEAEISDTKEGYRPEQNVDPSASDLPREIDLPAETSQQQDAPMEASPINSPSRPTTDQDTPQLSARYS